MLQSCYEEVATPSSMEQLQYGASHESHIAHMNARPYSRKVRSISLLLLAYYSIGPRPILLPAMPMAVWVILPEEKVGFHRHHLYGPGRGDVSGPLHGYLYP